MPIQRYTAEGRGGLRLIDRWRRKRSEGGRSGKETDYFSLVPTLLCVSLRWQVGARIIKALKNVRAGGRNDSLMTLTGNFGAKTKKKKKGRAGGVGALVRCYTWTA